MSDEPFNYLSIENGVNVINASSQVQNCPCKNILSSDRKAIWLSGSGLPQSFTLDLSNIIKRPKFFSCFGFDCWHDYASNPSMVELLISTDGEEFISWTVVHPELRAGVQLFQIDPLGARYNFLKVVSQYSCKHNLVIRETHGAPKTYLNQIFLFEENPLKKMGTASKVNESLSLNTSNIINQRKDSPAEEAHFADNLSENFSQPMESHIKAKLSQGNDDFDIFPAKSPNMNEHQNSLRKRPPSGVVHSNSMSKLDPELGAQNKFGINRNDQEFQRPTGAVSTRNPQLPLYPHTEPFEQKLSNASHENLFYQSQEEARPFGRRNSFGAFVNSEYNQPNFEQAQKPPQPLSSQGKIYSNSPGRVPQHPNYFRSPYNSGTQNAGFFQQEQQNDSFGSFLNDKLSSMNDEVKKLAHSKSLKSSDNFKEHNKNIPLEEDEMPVPMLTHTEKEVKQMKQEMNKWGGMMNSLQGTMTQLLEKVTEMQNNMDNVKTRVATLQKGGKEIDMKPEQENRNSHNSDKSSGDQPLSGPESFEGLRSHIMNYLENVMSQNQAIIQENQRLRQNYEEHNRNQNKGIRQSIEKDDMDFDPSVWSSNNLEKTITSIFEKNMKAWESSFFKKIKAQNNLLEERISEKLTGSIEILREEDQSFRRKVDEELKQLKLKVGYLEQSALKSSEISSYRLSDEFPITLKDKTNTMAAPRMSSKENVPYLQNQPQSKRGQKNVSSVDEKRNKQIVDTDSLKEQPLGNSSTSSLTKIQFLMDKLNNKIALRDKKMQMLQNQIVNHSPTNEKEALDSSRDSLGESLFNNNKKTINNISARKKVMK